MRTQNYNCNGLHDDNAVDNTDADEDDADIATIAVISDVVVSQKLHIRHCTCPHISQLEENLLPLEGSTRLPPDELQLGF